MPGLRSLQYGQFNSVSMIKRDMITVRDICSVCEHLWSEHREDAAIRFDSVVATLNGKPCSCCVRMAVKVRRLNEVSMSLNFTIPNFKKINKTSTLGTSMIEVGKVRNSTVYLDHESIALDGRTFTPKQAIELAQLLMKAAECQTEYAAAAKDLDEQKQQLDAKYKDMISGLGLENPDLQTKDFAKENGEWTSTTFPSITGNGIVQP